MVRAPPAPTLRRTQRSAKEQAMSVAEKTRDNGSGSVQDEVQSLRTDLAVQQATQAGAEATQAATQAGQAAANTAAHAGTMATMVAGGAGLIAGMMLGLMMGALAAVRPR